MMKLLEGLFARANYQIQGDAEKDFQYAMYIIFELLGEYVQTEKQTSNGRIDILIQTKDYVCIMELKVDGSADEALRRSPQIPANSTESESVSPQPTAASRNGKSSDRLLFCRISS